MLFLVTLILMVLRFTLGVVFRWLEVEMTIVCTFLLLVLILLFRGKVAHIVLMVSL